MAISDIHGRVAAVERLRALESNRFDAVVVAGDIGSEHAQAVMTVLATFECPVLYVYGNWDYDLPYDLDLGNRCRHLHHRGINIEGLFFTGFSGLPTHWGQNPIAAAIEAAVDDRHRIVLAQLNEAKASYEAAVARIEQEKAAQLDELASVTKNTKTKVYARRVEQIERNTAIALRREATHVDAVKGGKAYRAYLEDGGSAYASILESNRRELAAVVQELGPRRTIVVTHERLTHTTEDLYGVPLFLFGHRHGHEDKFWNGSRFVNVSALDQLVIVAPKTDDGSPNPRRQSWRTADIGSYVILETDGAGRVGIEPRLLWSMPEGWARLRMSAITPDRPPMLDQPDPPQPPLRMAKFPDKLHKMLEAGVDEKLIQTIFDALAEADDTGRRYTNIYLADEVRVLFSDYRAEADMQLRMFVERVGIESIAFERGSETWHERAVGHEDEPATEGR
ncbi:metallophosphoesterase family protein [Methylobacterium fujisawaense]|uniref:metallophosphoesterase family protein n=2 Tax=Bacteria TaxID=2 RepID=UPI003702EE45